MPGSAPAWVPEPERTPYPAAGTVPLRKAARCPKAVPAGRIPKMPPVTESGTTALLCRAYESFPCISFLLKYLTNQTYFLPQTPYVFPHCHYNNPAHLCQIISQLQTLASRRKITSPAEPVCRIAPGRQAGRHNKALLLQAFQDWLNILFVRDIIGCGNIPYRLLIRLCLILLSLQHFYVHFHHKP